MGPVDMVGKLETSEQRVDFNYLNISQSAPQNYPPQTNPIGRYVFITELQDTQHTIPEKMFYLLLDRFKYYVLE